VSSVQDEALRALNNRHARETSHLDAPAWRRLVDTAFAALTIDPPASLVVALDQDALYDSPNFLWFRRRYPRFVYVDRVVVAETARGRGLARALYAEVSARAQSAGHGILACEVNLVPANPASDAFHARLGFAEVGRAKLPGGGEDGALPGKVAGLTIRHRSRSRRDRGRCHHRRD